MSTERKTPKPIEVRQRPRRIAETEAEPVVQTLLTVPDLRKREVELAPVAPSLAAEVPVAPETQAATTAVAYSEADTGAETKVQPADVELESAVNHEPTVSAVSAASTFAEPEEQHPAPAIAPPQDVIGPNGKRKSPASPREEVNSDLTRTVKSLLGHAAMSESLKRNLGTLATIAAAIMVCTLIARSMKQPSAGESVTKVASLPQVGTQQTPASNAPMTDTGLFQTPAQVQVSAPVGTQTNGIFQGLPAVEDVTAPATQFANEMQQQATVLQQGVQAVQNQFQLTPDSNQNRLVPGSGVLGNPFRGDVGAVSQPNTPAVPNSNPNFNSANAPQNTQVPGRQLWPANPAMTPVPNAGPAAMPAGNNGLSAQNGGPFGNPVATGQPSPPMSTQGGPAAVNPANVWPQLQLNPSHPAAGGAAFNAPGATTNANPQLPVMPAMPSVHSFNDKTAANAYPATPQNAFPTLEEMNASLQRQKMERGQIRIGTRPAAAGNVPQAFAPNTNLNHGGALR